MYITGHYEPSDYKTVLIPRFHYFILQRSFTATNVTIWPCKLRYGPRSYSKNCVKSLDTTNYFSAHDVTFRHFKVGTAHVVTIWHHKKMLQHKVYLLDSTHNVSTQEVTILQCKARYGPRRDIQSLECKLRPKCDYLILKYILRRTMNHQTLKLCWHQHWIILY